MSRLLRSILVCAVLAAAGQPAGFSAAGAPAGGYQVEAVFLFNFLQFITWPPSAWPNPDAPIEIGVLGENPFGSALDDAVHNEIVRGHPLHVRYAGRLEDLGRCQVLFICASRIGVVHAILARIGQAPVLTVSDIPGFAAAGGVIGFYPDGKRIRFAINLAAARNHHLKPSAQLLSLARLVGPASGEP